MVILRAPTLERSHQMAAKRLDLGCKLGSRGYNAWKAGGGVDIDGAPTFIVRVDLDLAKGAPRRRTRLDSTAGGGFWASGQSTHLLRARGF